MKHHYHCVLCGTQLNEAGLGILACPSCRAHFIPTVNEAENTASVEWVMSEVRPVASPQEPNPYPEGSAAHYAFEHCVEPKEPQKPRISMEVGQKPGIGVDESTRMCMEERLVSSETLPKEQLANVYLGNQMGYPRYFAPCASCGEGSWPERFCPYCEGLLPTEPRLVIPG